MKAKLQIGITALSLLALLVYTLVHTGGLLARYVDPPFVGYVAAFGIEAAVVSLSLRIGELRKTKQSPTFFLFVMVAVVIVSAVANIAEGFTTVQGEQISIHTIRQLDPLQAVIGLAATGLISLIVLALAEIIGADVETAVKQVERERKSSFKEIKGQKPTNARPEKPEEASITDQSPSIEQARAAKAAQDASSKEQALHALMDHMSANPAASLSDIGRAIGRSKTTVANYIRELEQGGQIERNGRGWQIKEQ